MQPIPFRPAQSWSFDPDRAALTVDFGGPRLAVTALTPHIIRVRFAADGSFAPRRPWAVTRPEKDFPPAAARLAESEQALALDAGAFSAVIDRESGRVSFRDPRGWIFCADLQPPDLRPGGGFRLVKHTAPEEHFYGFGQRAGPLEKSLRRMENWTTDPARPHGEGVDPLYIAVPLYQSVQPPRSGEESGLVYGLYLNSTFRSSFDLNEAGRMVLQAEGGELDYYVFYGPSPAGVSAGIAELLGTMPLPPRWALGFHQSRWSYGDEKTVRAIAAGFRRRGLPCDCIHLDIDYMRGYRVFTWNQERFPDPARMAADLAAQGFHLTAIVDPGVKVDPEFDVYREGLERGCFVAGPDGEPVKAYCWPDLSVWPDFARPEVRRWWGQLQARLVNCGVRGIWNDMNEPATFSRPFSEGGGQVGTLPEDAVQGPPDQRAAHAEVHNLYASGMAQASYEGLRELLGDERPFVLCRSGFAGLQRWTASWMGDNHAWWSHLEMALPQLLNMGLSGQPFVGVDVGGFNANASPELYARWIQAGMLFPFYRVHSEMNTGPHEPWAFGEEVEEIARCYLRLRYRLLPYLYSLFEQASRTGAPILRPLLYHFPWDEQTYHLHDQVMLGPWLMAAPVYQPGRRHRTVYLPAGEWYDLWTEERLRGPATILAPAPLDRLPLYIRAGAVLPLGPEMQHTGEKPLDPLTWEVFPGEGEFSLYEDDGLTYGYARGELARTRLRQHLDPAGLTLEWDAKEGDYRPPEREAIVRVHGVDRLPPGLDLPADYDPDRRILTLRFPDRGGAQRIFLPLQAAS